MNAVKRLTLALGLAIGLQNCSWCGPVASLTLAVAFPNLKFNRPLWMEEIPDGSKRVIVIEPERFSYSRCDHPPRIQRYFSISRPESPRSKTKRACSPLLSIRNSRKMVYCIFTTANRLRNAAF